MLSQNKKVLGLDTWVHVVLTIISSGLWLIVYFICKSNMEQEAVKKMLLEMYLKDNTNANTSKNKNPYKNAVPKEIYQQAYISKKTSSYTSDYIIFDTETTGLEPEIDKIIELSAIKYVNGEPVETFTSLVNPKQKLDPFITSLTGITDNDLSNQPPIEDVLIKFFEFIEDYVLIAHNAPFDIKMIACEAYRSNIKMCENKVIDTISLAKRMISSEVIKNYKLSTLKKYFGIDIESHRALSDCVMCNIVYQKYLEFRKQKNKKEKIIIDETTGEILQKV